MLPQDSDARPEMLTLGRIALWYKNTTTDDQTRQDVAKIKTGIVLASVPILQRGLVWRPQQIEMFWDSLLRGFPVGSLVLSTKINDQERGSDGRTTHHILDGQQRCYAISLGFTDPFSEEALEHLTEYVSPILWLDLNPTILDGSTREYIAQLTTKAHPWGYRNNDNADRISATDKRKALNDAGVQKSQYDDRLFQMMSMGPHFSGAPIPMAWLMNADISSDKVILNRMSEKLGALKKYRWANKTANYLRDGNDVAHKMKYILQGVKRARGATVVALMAPDGLLDETARETRDGGQVIVHDQSNISNIEHLFQRLNQQGTPLNGEELAYSMIKAYWPELAKPIDEMKNRHMPASRVVALAVRLAMADDTKDQLPLALGVSQIRALAKKKDDKKIIDFIGEDANSPLYRANMQVDKWLRYSPTNPDGFLPVQITRLAMASPDVYLLLFWMAHRTMGDTSIQQNLRRPVQAIASWIHWFAIDKAKAVNCIYAECCKMNLRSMDVVKQGMQEALNRSLLIRPPTIDNLRVYLKLPQSDIEVWDWWKLANDDKGQSDELRKQFLEQMVFRIIGNKELLLYAQRRFLDPQFVDYDPSEKDMWQDYNCPWDYDHILAHYYVYYKRGSFQRFSSKWVNTIGNLRACSAEANRSDQKDLAKDKIQTEEDRKSSILLTNQEDKEAEEIAAFSGGESVRTDQAVAHRFANACWQRIIRIYGDWYNSVGIAELLQL